MNTDVSRKSVVLVLGANGRFGQAVCTAFAGAGWRVLAQTRRALAPALAAMPPIEPLSIGIDETRHLIDAAAGAQIVVHAMNPAYTTTAWQAQAPGMAQAAMDIAQALNATLMLPGNVYNFGPQLPAQLSESTPQTASSGKGAVRVAIEAQMRARAAQGLRSVVIRAGDFFGAGEGTWLDGMIVKSLSKGKVVYPGPLDVPHAWAYLPDLARTFVTVAEKRDTLAPSTTLHFAGHTLTGRQLHEGICKAADALGWRVGARAYRLSIMNWMLLRLASPFVPMLRELTEMAYLWRMPHALEQTALSRLIGAVPHTPLPLALADALNRIAPLIGMPEREPADSKNDSGDLIFTP
jgi:nucleoside-diphosphate-sugar epimerase